MKLKSFNEKIEVDFDEASHVYTYKGKQFLSASTFVHKYQREFDKERISKTFSEDCGVPQEDILQMWGDNGNSASGFGTSVHLVLENYFKNEATGAIVQQAKGKKHNAALPNHPVLRDIITSLIKILPEGDTEQEALISLKDESVCGLVDNLLIIDSKKKICRVRDYKITYDALVESSFNKMDAPFSYLGTTKLAKYYVQLAFYSYMLDAKGWKVMGIDILNYDGSWSIHSLEREELMKLVLLVASEVNKGVMKNVSSLEDMINEMEQHVS